jgi:hypothetical protein
MDTERLAADPQADEGVELVPLGVQSAVASSAAVDSEQEALVPLPFAPDAKADLAAGGNDVELAAPSDAAFPWGLLLTVYAVVLCDGLAFGTIAPLLDGRTCPAWMLKLLLMGSSDVHAAVVHSRGKRRFPRMLQC